MSFRQRKFRTKPAAEEAVDGDNKDAGAKDAHAADAQSMSSVAAPAVPSHGAASSKMPSIKPSLGIGKPSLLSFEEEGDDGVDMAIQLKKKEKERSKSGKGSSSKFGGAQALPELPSSNAVSQRSSAGEYSADRLKELQKNALTFTKDLIEKGADGEDAAPAAVKATLAPEPIIKLSGSFKAKPVTDGRFHIDSNGLVKPTPPPAAAAKDAMPLPPPARPRSAADQGGAASQASEAAKLADGEAEEDGDDDDSLIPDANMIKLAKAKRERLRQAHLAPDYIPLGGAAKLVGDYKEARARPSTSATAAEDVEEGEGLEGGSGAGGGGACEEGDASDDELEEHMRIKFGNGGAAGRVREGYLKTLHEEDEFAEEQLRKAVRARGQHAPPTAQLMQQSGVNGQQWGAVAGTVSMSGLHIAVGGAEGPATRARMDQISAAGLASLSSLQEGLKRLQSSSKSCQANLTRTSDNLASSLTKIEALEVELKTAGDKYAFIQKSKAYIADLCDCLAEKSLIVEELEDSLMELREDRAADSKEAKKALEAELLKVAEAGVSAATAVMSRSAATSAASIAAERAVESVEDDLLEGSSGAVELDEFGRNINLGVRREAEARAKQRAALLAAEENILKELTRGTLDSIPVGEEEEGDRQASSETRRYVTRHEEIMETASTVFADADEEYASLGAVKQRLEELKFRYPKQYESVYMHLSTPALFAPYVRLELLHWDPLYADSSQSGMAATRDGVHKGFDQQAWYESLFDYGVGADAGALDPDDPDNELVPQLVRKLVLPLAQHMLERCWEPCNVSSSRAAASLCGDLCVYVPAEEEHMKDLLDGVASALDRAVAGCEVPTWPPVITALVPKAEAVQLRRFRQALRLMHSISAFDALLSRSLLLPLVFTKLIAMHLLPYMRSSSGDVRGAVLRVEAVVAGIPVAWLAAGPPAEAAPLCDHVASLCQAMEFLRTDTDKVMLAERLVQVAKLLGQTERASRLASAFGRKG